MSGETTSEFRVGTDIGGTFTDIVFSGSNGIILTKKVLSTPDDYGRAITQGIREVLLTEGLAPSCIKEVVHGTTIVTNTCIELKGAKVGLITTEGFRDVLEIARGRMAELYNLRWNKPVPLVPRDLRLEVRERIGKKGEVIQALDTNQLQGIIERLVSAKVEAIAICLYNSPRNPMHEEMAEVLVRSIAPQIFVSRSTKIRPMLKEYERTSETVVNAYVMPVVTSYLRSLKSSLMGIGVNAPIFVMQSSGGMISADEAAEIPVEIVECGPAAGVVGAAFLAQQLQIRNIVTVDLGGTTTKASVVENGHFTRSAEYEVGAGIHRASRLHKGKGYVLRIPSIDIAEIGAGGGSLVWMDEGGLLNVGPKSAGAAPGPICYDKGGEEPTLTDSYIILGYMNPAYLLGGDFPLNADKARRVYQEKVATLLRRGVVEAAYGVYEIANSNIRRAITAVSSERGRDPRKFSLFVFGGAAALHGAAIARTIGMEEVIIAPLAGVFSAFGLLCADIQRIYVHAFDALLAPAILDSVNDILRRMTQHAIEAVRDHGYPAGATHIQRSADLRYQRQQSELTLPLPAGDLEEHRLISLQEDFHQEYERTFGFRLSNTPLEIVNLRVTSTIPVPRPARSGSPSKSRRPIRPGLRKAFFGARYGLVDAPVMALEDISAEGLPGPILVDTYDSTIVVPPDSRGPVFAGQSRYHFAIGLKGERMATKTQPEQVDLVTMYLINNLLFSIVDEMSLAVVRTSFSSLARDAFDFQCAIFKVNGDLIMEGEGTILHSLAYCYMIRRLLAKYGDNIHAGDVFLNNDPYSDASHLPDMYMLVPIFLDNRLIAWACSGGHMADVGGKVAGSCACDSTEIYQEGLRVPLIKFYEKGVPSDSVFDLIRANSRLPQIIIGDLESHHAACNTGKKRFLEMIQSYGWGTLEMYIDELIDYSERRTREEIRKLPNGDYEFTDYLDDDGFEDRLIPIKLKITVSDDTISYDFSGTSPQIKGSMNDPVGTTRAMILIGLRCMIDPEIPRNSGVWRPVKMIIPEGSLLNPVLPAPCGGRGATLSRLMDVLMGAEAQIVPNRMPACESGADWLICMGTSDKECGYTVLTETVWGGWGGRPFADGVDFCTPIFLDGSNQVCELNEKLYPFMYRRYGYVSDSEGAGKFRGSLAIRREWEFLGEEGTLQMRTERQRTQPWGLQGGLPGAFSQTILRRASGEEYKMHKETVTIKKGDCLCVISSGGGGWGNPLERDPEMVLNDVRNGGASIERAREVYGVIIDEKTLEMSRSATKRLRAYGRGEK